MENLIKQHQEAIRKNIINSFEKGRAHPIGTIKKFGNRQYIKTASGWKYYGKGTGQKAQQHHQTSKDVDKKKTSNKQSLLALKEKLSGFRVISESDKMLNLTKQFKGDHNVLIQDTANDDARFYVNLDSKIEINSNSLANKRANYQTTSARKVRHKRIKTVSYVDNISDVENLLEKHQKKVNRVDSSIKLIKSESSKYSINELKTALDRAASDEHDIPYATEQEIKKLKEKYPDKAAEIDADVKKLHEKELASFKKKENTVLGLKISRIKQGIKEVKLSGGKSVMVYTDKNRHTHYSNINESKDEFVKRLATNRAIEIL